MNQVVVLAGGFATRLSPLSIKTPKLLFKINNKTFLELQLELLRKGNVKKILYCLGHKSEDIIKHISTLKINDIEIDFSIEDRPLGTGGAIALALPKLEDIFGVIYGDSYLRINYGDLYNEFQNANKKALMTYINNFEGKETSNIRIRNSQIECYSKLNKSADFHYIDYGFSIFRKEVFLDLPKNEFLDLSNILNGLVKSNDIYGKEVFMPYFEIGSFDGIVSLENYLKGI